jgi:hypothetical protein
VEDQFNILNNKEMPFIQLQFRRDTATNWSINNPTLASGEMGIETDTSLFKIGIGTFWNSTPYGGLRGITGPTGPPSTLSFTGGVTGSVLYWDGIGVTGNSGLVYRHGVTGQLLLQGDLIPSSDKVYNLGTTGKRWKSIHAETAVINTQTLQLINENNGDNVSISFSGGKFLFTDFNAHSIVSIGNEGINSENFNLYYGGTGNTGATGTLQSSIIQGSIGPTGPTGPTGTQLVFFGEWFGNNDGFNENTVVTSPSDKNTYISKNVIVETSTDPSLNSLEWTLFVNKGLDGSDGKMGDRGTDGINGIDGAPGPTGEKGDTGPTGEKGDTGPTALSNFKGAWTNGFDYFTGDVVEFYGSSYYASQIIFASYSPPGNGWILLTSRGETGSTGPKGDTGPNNIGNVLRVDQIYGNDSTASPGGSPYLTINAAIAGVTLGQTIWVMPGTYNLSSGITLPNNICLRGLNTQTTTIQMLGVSQDTTLLTMGENCRVEDLTLKLGSTDHYNLTGIQYGGTSSQTSKLRNCVLSVNNSSASDSGTSNVYGILFSGSGYLDESSFSFNAVKGATINVKSNGNGTKRGFLITGSNQVSTRDTNIYVSTPTSGPTGSSYVGVETADIGGTGSIQIRSTSIGAPKQANYYTSSDILQTYPSSLTDPTYLVSPGIQIGPGTDLVTKSAGGKPFTTYIYPTTIYFGGYGDCPNNARGYLWPGTMSFAGGAKPYPDTTLPVARYRVQQPAILSGISATCNAISGSSATITICKNASPANGDTISNATPFTVTLTGTTLSDSFYNSSVDFAAGDYINVFINVSGNGLKDLAVQLDMF